MSEIAEPTAEAERPRGTLRRELRYPSLARRVGIGLSEAEGIKTSDDAEVARSEV